MAIVTSIASYLRHLAVQTFTEMVHGPLHSSTSDFLDAYYSFDHPSGCIDFDRPGNLFMTKAFVPSSSTARWTMILAALLPGFVYFGHSEERMVIGIFFLILAPLFAALASKYKSHLAIFASAALAATSAHFQPFMLFSPLTIFAVLISRSDGRSYLKTPWPWVGLWFYLLLVLEPTLQAVNNIVYGIGPANNWFSQIFALKPDMLFI